MTMYVLTSTCILSMLAPVEFFHTGQIKVGKYIWWCIYEKFVISQCKLVYFHRGVLVRGPALNFFIGLLCATPLACNPLQKSTHQCWEILIFSNIPQK